MQGAPVKKAVCRYDSPHFCFNDLASVSAADAMLCSERARLSGVTGREGILVMMHDGRSGARESIVSTTVDRTKQT